MHSRTEFTRNFTAAALALFGLTVAAVPAQAKILWLPVQDVKDEQDVITNGELLLAVNL